MRDDALPFGRIVAAGAAIAAAAALAIGAVLALTHARSLPPGGAPIARPHPPEAGTPSLQTAPQPDLAAYREEKRRALAGLGWTDRAGGLAHVPVAVAMDVLVARAAAAASAASPAAARTAVEAGR